MTITLRTPSNLDNFVAGTVTATDDAITLNRIRATGGVSIQVTGTWTGTITFEVITDEVAATWVTFFMTPSNSATDAGTTTGNGAWSKAISGYKSVRARFSTASSGTPAIAIRYTP